MPRGGARPGAGRKRLETRVEQESRRDTILRVCTDADWEAIVRKAVEQAKTGDCVARQWLTPYVAGKPPEVAAEATDKGMRFTITIDRQDAERDDAGAPDAAR